MATTLVTAHSLRTTSLATPRFLATAAAIACAGNGGAYLLISVVTHIATLPLGNVYLWQLSSKVIPWNALNNVSRLLSGIFFQFKVCFVNG